MNQNVLPATMRFCPHCHDPNSLAYYKEANQKKDYYYCQSCYRLVLWDGITPKAIAGEAYPNRDKKGAIHG